jgi:hypothetical protein
VRDRKTPRVESLTRKRPQGRSERRIHDLRPPRLAVHPIADNRPSSRGQVNTDLMHTACGKPAANE